MMKRFLNKTFTQKKIGSVKIYNVKTVVRGTEELIIIRAVMHLHLLSTSLGFCAVYAKLRLA